MIKDVIRKLTGKKGEDDAANHLRSLGFSITAQNVKCKYYEIDIIAKKDDTLFFFEVRTRKHGLSSPLETIDEKKRDKVWRAAELYLSQSKWNGPCEIGYIGIDKKYTPPKVECVLDEG